MDVSRACGDSSLLASFDARGSIVTRPHRRIWPRCGAAGNKRQRRCKRNERQLSHDFGHLPKLVVTKGATVHVRESDLAKAGIPALKGWQLQRLLHAAERAELADAVRTGAGGGRATCAECIRRMTR
jgi:hypothetical protein